MVNRFADHVTTFNEYKAAIRKRVEELEQEAEEAEDICLNNYIYSRHIADLTIHVEAYGTGNRSRRSSDDPKMQQWQLMQCLECLMLWMTEILKAKYDMFTRIDISRDQFEDVKKIRVDNMEYFLEVLISLFKPSD